jgi:Tfp pilus assembly protein PilO
MKASTKRLLALLGSATLLLVTLIIYAVLLRPEYSVIQDLRGNLNSRVNFSDAQSKAIDYVNNLYGKNKVSIDQIQNDLSSALPDQERVADVVYQIQAISSLNNIAVDSINLDKLPIQQAKDNNSLIKSYGTLRITLSLVGSYSSFKEMISLLQNNIRLMDLRTLRVYQVNNLEKGIFNYEMVVDTYYQIK